MDTESSGNVSNAEYKNTRIMSVCADLTDLKLHEEVTLAYKCKMLLTN